MGKRAEKQTQRSTAPLVLDTTYANPRSPVISRVYRKAGRRREKDLAVVWSEQVEIRIVST